MTLYERDYLQEKENSGEVVSSFANRVYGWMAIGLALTATIAYTLFKTGAYQKIFPYYFVWLFLPLGISLIISGAYKNASAFTVKALFLTYAASQGLLLGTILPAYARAYGGDLIWSAFTTAAVLFGVTVLYGIVTKSDITKFKSLFTIALLGLVIVSVIYFILSFFIHLTWPQLFMSYVGLAIFLGLTAIEAQQIKQVSQQVQGRSEAAQKFSVMMALQMYLNLLMIFWYILSILSSKRRSN